MAKTKSTFVKKSFWLFCFWQYHLFFRPRYFIAFSFRGCIYVAKTLCVFISVCDGQANIGVFVSPRSSGTSLSIRQFSIWRSQLAIYIRSFTASWLFCVFYLSLHEFFLLAFLLISIFENKKIKSTFSQDTRANIHTAIEG